MKVKKIVTMVGDRDVRKFEKIAKMVIDYEVGETSDENRKVIAMFTARDMAIGAMLERRKIVSGIAVRLIGALVIYNLVYKVKDEKKTEEENEE